MIGPSDLPELRARLIEWGGRAFPPLYLDSIENGTQKAVPAGMSAARLADYLAELELRRLRYASLYYVTAEMAALADHAGRDWPLGRLDRTELPALDGFIFFDYSLAIYPHVEDSALRRITAASWGIVPRMMAAQLPPAARMAADVLWVSLWVDTDFMRAEFPDLSVPPIWLENETMVPLDHDYEVPDGDGNPYRVAFRTILAAWAIMQQPRLAQVSAQPLSRGARRRMERLDLPTDATRVVTLRKQAGQPAETEPALVRREWLHQWIVNGHPRRQWYPSEGVHRSIWIEPYRKGPPDKPLLHGEKVYNWRRF